MSEWLNYISYRNLEDRLKNREYGKAVMSYIRILVQGHDEETVARCYGELIGDKEPSTEELLSFSREHLSPRCGSEAVLSIGSGIEWLNDPAFAGVISVMPHGCMPGGIVAAMAEKFTGIYEKPWISLTYDGFAETNNLTRINEFAELIRFCQKNGTEKQPL
jgi:predicted nucleotide-binding protein (sugar kinase/HSP70/actin superfamily)